MSDPINSWWHLAMPVTTSRQLRQPEDLRSVKVNLLIPTRCHRATSENFRPSMMEPTVDKEQEPFDEARDSL